MNTPEVAIITSGVIVYIDKFIFSLFKYHFLAPYLSAQNKLK